ncbi:aspartate aminotransferase family protein [Bacillus sp. CH126_4D]|uniref:aspartate aminotransferase family protein n=1 Tax=unclassified Bacillus (in: firmicutes) TaxID=185979 RepID=UPI00124F0AD8|nr:MULTISPECIES: aspartate aminotransferase family protein [unclassified Bacillus (in: firmicutes)]KAB2460950.1 aspartate aminotransferase family protein [Bacillus sp. CH140a_4T]KAB2475032.1 aspartate aminotransferase family protein [Bacillus sp. CH126_4D]
MSISSISTSSVLKPNMHKSYPIVEYGEGIYIYDQNNKKYMDGCSGAIVANIGHGIKEIAEIGYKQLSKIAFTYRTQFTNQPLEDLGEKITNLSPNLSHIFFSNSGSEATETALRLAIQYWQEVGKQEKNIILSRKISYHGVTLGALSMSGSDRRIRFEELLTYNPAIPTPYCYRCPFSKDPKTCNLECARAVETVINQIGSHKIAGIIMEPVVGASGGALTPSDGYFEIVREICNKHDILLICDEVMTGLGRTGEWFGINNWNVEPDIIALGKGMSAGYTPISGVLFNQKIYDAINEGSGVAVYGHTYSGNPGSAAISLGVLDYIESNDLVTKVKNKEEVFNKKLNELKNRFECIGDVRGKGLLWGVELVSNREQRTTFSRNLNIADIIVDIALENGLLIYPVKNMVNYSEGDAFLIAPPFTISEDEVDELFNILTKSMTMLENYLVEKGIK